MCRAGCRSPAHPTFVPHIKSGRLREIAVTSLQPSPAFPGLPTMASVAPGFSANIWAVVFAPAGTPAPLVQRLNRELNQIALSKEAREIFAADGAAPVAATPEELSRRNPRQRCCLQEGRHGKEHR